jgi:hypothetical protein
LVSCLIVLALALDLTLVIGFTIVVPQTIETTLNAMLLYQLDVSWLCTSCAAVSLVWGPARSALGEQVASPRSMSRRIAADRSIPTRREKVYQRPSVPVSNDGHNERCESQSLDFSLDLNVLKPSS